MTGASRRIASSAQLGRGPRPMDAGAGHDHDPRRGRQEPRRVDDRRRVRDDRPGKLDAGDVALERLRSRSVGSST